MVMKPHSKYQWPASRITPEDMAILHRLRGKTGIPINQLLKAAIAQFETLCTDEFLKSLQNGKVKITVVKSRLKPKESNHKTYRIVPFVKQSKPEA